MMEVIDSARFDELLFAVTDKIRHRREMLLSGERQALMKGVDMEAFMTAVSGLGDTMATRDKDGFLSASEKRKLDSLPTSVKLYEFI